MKGLKLTTIGFVVLALAACSEKDKAYYLQHIDKAKQKWTECRKEGEAAFMRGDEEALQKLEDKQSECMQAREALQEHERAEREKAKKEEQARIEAAIVKEKAKLNQELEGLNWVAVSHKFVNSQCSKGFSIAKNDYPCLALKSIYDEKTEAAKTELQKLSLADILTQEKTYCSKDQRRYSACDIWRQATETVAQKELQAIPFETLSFQEKQYCAKYDAPACKAWRSVTKEQEKALVKHYVENFDVLKQVYNQCVDRYQNTKGWDAQNKIGISYPCQQAKKAKIELGLGYDNLQNKLD